MPNDTGVDSLIRKYAAGRFPALLDDQSLEEGLLTADVFRVWAAGLQSRLRVDITLLVPGPSKSRAERWSSATHLVTPTQRPGLCIEIHDCVRARAACRACYQRHAVEVEESNAAMAYLCTHGLVVCAAPVVVDDVVKGIVFGGGFLPSSVKDWSRESWQRGEVLRPRSPHKPGVDVSKTSRARLRRVVQVCGPSLEARLDSARSWELKPANVETLRQALEVHTSSLAGLAELRYLNEKAEVVTHLSKSLAASLTADQGPDDPDAVRSIMEFTSRATNRLRAYFGMDFLLVLQCHPQRNALRFLLFAGDYDRPPLAKWLVPPATTDFAPIRGIFADPRLPDDYPVDSLNGLPFFRKLVRDLGLAAAPSCIQFSWRLQNQSACLLLAGSCSGFRLADFRKRDRTDFGELLGDIRRWSGGLLAMEREAADLGDLEQFLEDVAHDIRNPIQSALVKIDLIKQMDRPKDIKKQVRRLGALLRRIHALSEKVWIVAQLRHGWPLTDKLDRVPVFQVLMEAVHTIEDTAREKNVSISGMQSISHWKPMELDERLLVQALVNLLDNAVKYSFPNTDIRVEGRMQFPEAQLRISNVGIGISQSEISRIFNRGYRGKEARQYIRQGTGLGLYVVRAFADSFGDVRVESMPTRDGSSFRTTFTLDMLSGGRR